MTQKLSSEKLMATLLQSIDPGLIADEGVRQTVEVLLNLVEQLNSKVKQLEEENYNLAETFSKQGLIEQAIVYYSKAANITSISLHEKKLMEAIREYDYDLTQALLKSFTKNDFNNNSSNFWKELTQDSEASKKLGLLFFKVGQTLSHKGLYKESELILHSAIKLNPNLHWAHHLLACISQRNGKYQQSIEHFKSAIKLNPSEFGHYWRLAQTYRAKEDINLAIDVYNKALSLRKDDRVQQELDALLILQMVSAANSFSQKGCLTNAYVENAICQYLDRPDLLIKLGDWCEEKGHHSEANCVKQAVSVYFELCSSSKLMLIIFASRNDIHANIQFQFRNLLSKVDINKFFVRDVHDAWYSKGIKNIATNVDGVAHYLKQQVDQIKPAKLITLGSSSGGYAALLFGFLLNAEKSIAFSPQTKIPRPQPFPDEDLLAGCDSKYFDLLDLEWEDVKTVCSIHFSEDFISDRDAALRMEKYSNFNLYGYQAGKIHNIAGWLKNQGKLESILLELTEGS